MNNLAMGMLTSISSKYKLYTAFMFEDNSALV